MNIIHWTGATLAVVIALGLTAATLMERDAAALALAGFVVLLFWLLAILALD